MKRICFYVLTEDVGFNGAKGFINSIFCTPSIFLYITQMSYMGKKGKSWVHDFNFAIPRIVWPHFKNSAFPR